MYDPFYVVTLLYKLLKTSWTHSICTLYVLEPFDKTKSVLRVLRLKRASKFDHLKTKILLCIECSKREGKA